MATVRVHGLHELQRDLQRASRDIAKDLRNELKEVGEPVRALAAAKAAGVGHVGPVWSRMRLGITSRTVYVAPKTRPHGGSARPNLAPLLMDRAMQPALDQLTPEIYTRLDAMLDSFANSHGF